jgi:hypothetical protein
MRPFLLLVSMLFMANLAIATPIEGGKSPKGNRPSNASQVEVEPQIESTRPTQNDSTQHQSPLQVFVQGMVNWMYGSETQDSSNSRNNE